MPEDEKKNDSEPIVVKDKRRFTKDGELKETEKQEKSGKKAKHETPAAEAKKPTESHTAEKPHEAHEHHKHARDEAHEHQEPHEHEEPAGEEAGQIPLGEISFSNFILSLSSVALLNLGEVPNPTTGKIEKNIAMAKYHIDILEMIEKKTRGNLDPAEEQLLEHLLYQLRMRYVAAVK
jgi:hypothetical protein